MRTIAVMLAVVALAACGGGSSSSTPSGKPDGSVCAAGGECQTGLCFAKACVRSLPASASCAPPGSPRIVLGDPVVATEPPPGTCVSPVRDPVLAGGELQDLGELGVGTKTQFQVPDGTASFTIMSQAVPGTGVSEEVTFGGSKLPNTVVPTDVLLPDGRVFFDDLAPLPSTAGYDDVTGVLGYYGGASPISGSFGAPNTSAALDLVLSAGQVSPGTWSFTVNDWARECLSVSGCSGGSSSGSYRVHVVTQPGPLSSTGTLDLEVYLVTDPAGELPNAAAAVANPQTQRWVSGIAAFYANAGICLGTVTFRDLPDWVRPRYAPNGVVDVSGGGGGLAPDQVPAGCDDLSQLFTAGLAPSRAVHLFLAEELVDASSPSLGTTLGVDGSIPGPSGFPGTVNGGAVVGIFGTFGQETTAGACSGTGGGRFACGTDLLAYVAAHEAGHWLGLYHPTEWTGTSFDPLSDTPVCPCAVCVAGSQRAACAERGAANPIPVSASTCNKAGLCGGAQNLMFWQLDPRDSEGRLTREQGDVMRLNPAVH